MESAPGRLRHPSELDLRKLQLLAELEQHGTVSAVAAALHLTPSAISQQLAALSKDLGVRLTEPVGRRLRLTAQARLVLQHTTRIFDTIEGLFDDLAAQRDGEAGQVSVAGFATTLAPLILPAAGLLKQTHPRLRTALAEVDPPDSFERLSRGETDVAIAVEAPDAPAHDARFDKVPLMREIFDVALPTGHHLIDAPTLGLPDLADEAWIFATVGMCQEIPLAACAAAGFVPQATHAIGDWEATFAAVRAGLGISLVPRLARPVARDGVVVREFTDAPSRRVFAAVRRGEQRVPQIAAVLDALRETAAAEESNALRAADQDA
ncbi:LysR family transcriptional regulator [Streptomyces sp. CBMA123]|uniref:LysR family transcriptional regulator n=1 Tax=Streptomyces sp. CBMA123 TaxID=1896313 RepID=UPI001CB81F93|nr:LysR family transcriptional regulator [Streptomyces sp. CBMA123]MBD0694694.1 LysR family transcriptional regulator [Streptomyces sp. CBMA123]